MTTVFCTAWSCKYYKPHDEDCGICDRDYITLDEYVDDIYQGCPDYEDDERSE